MPLAPVYQIAAVLPASWRRGPTYWYWKIFLRYAFRWGQERINEWQLRHLKHMVQYAWDRSVGYRAVWKDAGVSPSDLQRVSDLAYFPLITKQQLRDSPSQFRARQWRGCYITTGGSTGIPFGFHVSRANLAMEAAFMHAGWERVGWRLGTLSAILRGAFVGSPENHWKYNPFYKELYLSSYYLTDSQIPTYLELFDRYRPAILQAYPSALNLLIELLQKQDKRLPDCIRLILLGSENIFTWQLEKFKKFFPNATFFSWYGHAEMAILAPRCVSSNEYHPWPFYGYTEIVRPDGTPAAEGEDGELIGTSFHNYDTPFIRYRTLDGAIRSSDHCQACGHLGLSIRQIVGRNQDFIQTSTGRLISMAALNMHDSLFDGLYQFQFYQEKPGAVLFRYIPKHPLQPQEVKMITSGIKAKLGHDIELRLEAVTDIPRTASGKHLFLDQRLNIPSREGG